MIRRFFRWLLNKDELEAINANLAMIHLLLVNHIERQTPKRNEPLKPISPMRSK